MRVGSGPRDQALEQVVRRPAPHRRAPGEGAPGPDQTVRPVPLSEGRGLFAGMTVRENLSLGRLARKTDGSPTSEVFAYFIPQRVEFINSADGKQYADIVAYMDVDLSTDLAALLPLKNGAFRPEFVGRKIGVILTGGNIDPRSPVIGRPPRWIPAPTPNAPASTSDPGARTMGQSDSSQSTASAPGEDFAYSGSAQTLAYFARSTDGGRSWEPARAIFAEHAPTVSHDDLRVGLAGGADAALVRWGLRWEAAATPMLGARLRHAVAADRDAVALPAAAPSIEIAVNACRPHDGRSAIRECSSARA